MASATARWVFPHPGADSDKLQHLRKLLPCDVRVTSTVHPLFGQLLSATGFKRRDGVLFLVVVLPDGSPSTIPAEVTDVLGGHETSPLVSVLSVEGIQQLRLLVTALAPSRPSRSRAKTRK